MIICVAVGGSSRGSGFPIQRKQGQHIVVLPRGKFQNLAAGIVQLQGVVISPDIHDADFFQPTACDGAPRLTLQQIFRRIAGFNNFNTSRCHTQETVLPLALYLLCELVVLVENWSTDKSVAIDAQVVDTTDGHCITVETAAVHPQQYRVFQKLRQVDARCQHTASVTVQAARTYNYFFCHWP